VDLFGDFSRIATKDRNMLLFVLTDPNARALFGAGWAKEARRVVSLLRAAHDLWAADAAFAELVERLRTGCPEFGAWWQSHDVGAPVSGTKLLHHPVRGRLRFEYATFQANDDPRLKLAIYLER
jgi:hypothetical protein